MNQQFSYSKKSHWSIPYPTESLLLELEKNWSLHYKFDMDPIIYQRMIFELSIQLQIFIKKENIAGQDSKELIAFITSDSSAPFKELNTFRFLRFKKLEKIFLIFGAYAWNPRKLKSESWNFHFWNIFFQLKRNG